MIARVWRGVTRPGETADAYVSFLRQSVIHSLKEIKGFLGSRVFRRDTDAGTEFLVTTYWASMEAVMEFAGENPEQAVIEPEAADYLVDFEETVRHYEVAASK